MGDPQGVVINKEVESPLCGPVASLQNCFLSYGSKNINAVSMVSKAMGNAQRTAASAPAPAPAAAGKPHAELTDSEIEKMLVSALRTLCEAHTPGSTAGLKNKPAFVTLAKQQKTQEPAAATEQGEEEHEDVMHD